MAEHQTETELEIAHVLFIDVVGYSQLLVDDQREVMAELNRLVRATEAFQTAEQQGKLARVPTGDGMALAFFTNPEAPARCAVELARWLRGNPLCRVRMGLHSGPVSGITDVNDRSNIAGAGMNIAQRVMDCGDAGHILLSRHIAEDLENYRVWQPYLHELGECEVKHGTHLGVVNLYSNDFGNSEVPNKLKPTLLPPTPNVAPRWRGVLVLTAVVLMTVVAAGLFSTFRRSAPLETSIPAAKTAASATAMEVPDKSIAVLPFQNLSDDKENSYFADGVQDQILTNLAKVSDLRVISHTSVRQYKSGGERNLREIAQQLGVAYILEGSVQRAMDRLRINAELIDARTDAHIWAETYDRTAADLFVIQSDLAQAIVAQLKARLSPQQKAQIEERPTQDLVAFELYQQGKEIVDSYLNAVDVRAALLKALQALDQATKRDPNFVLAYCYAARAHDLLYFFDLDPRPDRVLLAEAAAKAALRLQTDSAEARFAMGDYYFRCQRDYDRAQQELAIARPALPNSSPFFILSGYINRRQNHWPEAERDFSTAMAIDPRNPNAYNLLADTYSLKRQFAKGVECYNRVLAAGEQTPLVGFRRAAMEFYRSGDPRPFANFLQEAPLELDYAGSWTPPRVLMALIERDYAKAEQVLAASPRPDFQDLDLSFYYPKSWFQGMIALRKGDREAARAAFENARTILEQRLVVKPEHARTLAVLAQVDAHLGRKEQALREAQHAVELMPISKDIYDGVLVLEGLDQVYTWTGDRDRAIELLQRLLKMPGYISYTRLKFNPTWDALRGDPRFEQIVASLAPK